MSVRVFNPRVEITSSELQPGEWLLIDKEELVVVSGMVLKEVLTASKELGLEKEELLYDRKSRGNNCELHPHTFTEPCPQNH